jgi:transcriptional regulator with XRE-family HTH domain
MSQQELAKVLNMKQSTLANYESGSRNPNIEIMIQIANFFSVTLDELVERKSGNYDDFIAISDKFLDHLLKDEMRKAEMIAKRVLANSDIGTLYFKLFRYALSKLGWLWEVGALTIAKEHQVSNEITRMIDYFTKSNGRNILSRKERILGMAAPGEKHNIGLKMILSSLELRDYETLYIGEAVPTEDLVHHLNKGSYEVLVLSITNVHLKETLIELIERLPIMDIYVVGMGAKNMKLEGVEIFTSYEECLEAINDKERH